MKKKKMVHMSYKMSYILQVNNLRIIPSEKYVEKLHNLFHNSAKIIIKKQNSKRKIPLKTLQ